MIFRLDDDIICFPTTRFAEPDGLLAFGGKLTPEWLLTAYCNGIFPWFAFEDNEEPAWYSPHRRFVIFPEEIHVSHSMRTLLNSGRLQVTFNRDFEGTIRGCSEVDGRIFMDGAWLGEDMIQAYMKLHELGYAASVEVWEEGRLIGGLYGVTIGHCFCGESMFSRKPNASKAALIGLARKLQEAGEKSGEKLIIDCQLETPHLKSMGGRFISRDEYERYLK